MTTLRYIGAEARVETFGKIFAAAEWTDDTGLTPDAVATLSQNPQFEVRAAPAADSATVTEDAGGAPALQEPAV